jgi:hypothetical protein
MWGREGCDPGDANVVALVDDGIRMRQVLGDLRFRCQADLAREGGLVRRTVGETCVCGKGKCAKGEVKGKGNRLEGDRKNINLCAKEEGEVKTVKTLQTGRMQERTRNATETPVKKARCGGNRWPAQSYHV